MDLTEEELREIEELEKEVNGLQQQYNEIGVTLQVKKTTLNELKSTLVTTQDQIDENPRLHRLDPETDVKRKEEGKPPRRKLLPNEPLFPDPPTDEEKYVKGRVRLVTDESEMISYPLPNEVIDSEPAVVFATSLFYDLSSKGKKSDLRQGNDMFDPVTYVPFISGGPRTITTGLMNLK